MRKKFLIIFLLLTTGLIKNFYISTGTEFEIYRRIRGLGLIELKELDANFTVVIDGKKYRLGEGFKGFRVAKLDAKYGGIFDKNGVLIYKFLLEDAPDITDVDVIEEGRIKTLKPKDRRYEYIRQKTPSRLVHNYTVSQLPSLLLTWGIQIEKLDLTPEEKQHLVDIINYFSVSRIKAYIDKYRDIELKKVLNFLIHVSDPEASLLIAENLPNPYYGSVSRDFILYLYDLEHTFAPFIANQFYKNARAIISGEVNPEQLPDRFTEKIFYLSEEIKESILEAFHLIHSIYKFGIQTHDYRWLDEGYIALKDFQYLINEMIEYGYGILAQGSMGNSFPNQPKENLIYYRTDERQLYIFRGGRWERVSDKGSLASRIYKFIFSNPYPTDAELDIHLESHGVGSHIRWKINLGQNPMGLSNSPELGFRVDTEPAKKGDRNKWMVWLDIDSNSLNRVFAQAKSLGINIYELTHTDHWQKRKGHHFWLEVFCKEAEPGDFQLVSKLYAPIFLFGP
ncbi:MAG: hypothetical protein NC920_00470 [Candidatus Omnitrophica bacterium]|nr:hypothetical protein [Candidatus Omnitrophota bacterium]